VALVAAVASQWGHTMRQLSILVLSRYGNLGASSRLRCFQYLPTIADEGIQSVRHPLFTDSSLAERYQHGGYRMPTLLHAFSNRLSALRMRQKFDLLWIEKEALPWWPLWIELAMLNRVPFVLDYDDAIFHNYDHHHLSLIRKIFGKRLDGLMAKAALVICGNNYLVQRARDAGAPWVEVLPTVIDLDRYPNPHPTAQLRTSTIPKLVWIGSPSTLRYLELLRDPLQRLARHTSFTLRVIGGEYVLPGVDVEYIPWSESTEVSNISECDVGVMPLFDSPWERGKCGYKLIQYMACGLPVVASPVGVNSSIVQEGVNGFLADTSEDWFNRLERLLSEASLRSSMGAAGRLRVEQDYCLQVTGPRLASLLRRVAGAEN
jgi:glycosyltransferase involved in cell wall biosynthesis